MGYSLSHHDETNGAAFDTDGDHLCSVVNPRTTGERRVEVSNRHRPKVAEYVACPPVRDTPDPLVAGFNKERSEWLEEYCDMSSHQSGIRLFRRAASDVRSWTICLVD